MRYTKLRILYTCVFYLLTPLLLLRLYWKSLKAPAYRKRWLERFGFYRQKYQQDVIWLHAVSVGEAEALFPLIQYIQNLHPHTPLLVTCTTTTGSKRINTVLQDTVAHVYLPYDMPDAVFRFMHCFRPRMAVFVETEIWPNVYAYCGAHNIPLYLINARLSSKSCRNYQKIASLIAPALHSIKLIACQTVDDANRFMAIGAHKKQIQAVGNIKFDIVVPQQLIERGIAIKLDLLLNRPVWLIASTHKGEEVQLIKIYLALKAKMPQLLLVIAPRHPERFGDVNKLCVQHNLAVISYTSGLACQAGTEVFLVDTIGELKQFYVAADVAFVGGSLVDIGGHNILEPAALGTPILFGPYMSNFKQIADDLTGKRAAIQCLSSAEIAEAVTLMLNHPGQKAALVANAKDYVAKNLGAIERTYQILLADIK
ncbi:MAG: lipid IV(A) 3-deoxy-D-manno-octulosonic acid transferase [Methylococcaceae bacterium]|jgi:3-deoxy-D-manno-octulosonic-acid transferase